MALDLKKQPNRRVYIETLRRMTPEQRLEKAFELSDLTHEALRVAVATRHPEASSDELQALYLERLERCRRRSS
jgi:hypothetical protein